VNVDNQTVGTQSSYTFTNVQGGHLIVAAFEQNADVTAPTAPASLRATAGPALVTLNWLASSDDVGVTSYLVDASTRSNFSTFVSGFNRRDVGNVLSFNVTGLTPGSVYYFRVRAKDGAGHISAPSNRVSARPSRAVTLTLSQPKKRKK
jgi:predicted phage tail protein